MIINKENIKKIAMLLLVLAVIVIAIKKIDLIAHGVGIVIGIITPFLLGLILAFILNIPMSFFERKLFHTEKLKDRPRLASLARGLSILLSIVIVFLVIGFAVVLLVPEIGNSIAAFISSVKGNLPEIHRSLVNIGNKYPAVMSKLDLDSWIEKGTSYVGKNISSWSAGALGTGVTAVSKIVSGVFESVVGLIFAIYVLTQKEQLQVKTDKVMFVALSEGRYNEVKRVCNIAAKVFHSFISGQCAEAIITGTMFYLVLTIMRFPYALLIGVIVGLCTFIPIFGAIFGTIIGAILIMSAGLDKLIIYLIVSIILQQLEGNVIYPHVVGSSIGLPPMWILVAVTLGGSLFGVFGMIIFIPIFSVIYLIVNEKIEERYLEKLKNKEKTEKEKKTDKSKKK